MSEYVSQATSVDKKKVRFGHSPDADDAFMFFAIANRKVEMGSFEIEHVVEDIESLNKRALKAELEVTAVSFHAYAHISDRYAIMSAGASFGIQYGPIVVTKTPQMDKNLKGKKIAIPGTMTSAYLVLKLYEQDFQPVIVPFDQILNYVYEGKADAGLLIHEGQLTYGRFKLHKVLDLGAWWYEKTSLPLPLGADVVRKDLPLADQKTLTRILRASIEYALTNRNQALEYSLPYSRGLSDRLLDEFVGMYVNEHTLQYDDKAKKAVQKLLEWGHKAKILPKLVKPEFIEP